MVKKKKKSSITKEDVLAMRQAAHLTQPEAAETIFESPSSWQALEKGRRIMSEGQAELFRLRVQRRQSCEQIRRAIASLAFLGALNADGAGKEVFEKIAALAESLQNQS